MLSLFITGETGFLQLDVRWQAAVETMEALRREIARQHPAIDPARLRFRIAPVTVESVDLLLTPEGGDKMDVVLATSNSSGAPPYNALFSVALTAPQQDLVIAALHERRGVLGVRYRVTRSVAVEATVAIRGDVQSAFETLGENATVDECRGWLVEAMAIGELRRTRSGSPLAADDLWQRAENATLDQAAEWLQRAVQAHGPHGQNRPQLTAVIEEFNRLAATVTLTGNCPLLLVRTTDIATWFKGGDADDHIRVVG
jgi:hypothetical protein